MENCEENTAMVVGIVIGIVITFVLFIIGHIIITHNHPIVCKNNKLYEIKHDGNITIYVDTFRECMISK